MATPKKDPTDKSKSVINKITGFFKSLKTSEATAEEEPADDEGEDETEAEAEEATAEEEDSSVDSPVAEDDDTDVDANTEAEQEEEDNIEVDGKAVNLKDPKATRTAIETLMSRNAQQTSLLKEAKTTIEANLVELGKTSEEVKKDIKSSFQPNGSKRSNKATAEKPVASWAKPAEGSIAEAAVKGAVGKK